MAHAYELPYCDNTDKLFTPLANQAWSMLLDSSYPFIASGRYDVIVANPEITIETVAGQSVVTTPSDVIHTEENPFQLLRHYLAPYQENNSGLPFCGGAVGYFSYDLLRYFEPLVEKNSNPSIIPDLSIGLYNWAVVVDHHKRQSWFTSYGQAAKSEWLNLIDRVTSQANSSQNFQVLGKPARSMSKTNYMKAFNEVQRLIKEGDCYQINLAQHFSFDYGGNIWQAYQALREYNPAPFAACLQLPQGTVLSLSPERFLKLHNKQVETCPIKGTRPRSRSPKKDSQLAQDLLASRKDRAENLMIVDLLRNDLGKNCEAGSISVPKLFDLESFAAVHHLVSTVTGKLQHNKDALDLLHGCFPGGSITGTPKIRAMKIIEELESFQRSAYCGAIGYIGYDGNMDMNIAIRTLVATAEKIHCWAGGGIVVDSKPEQEYQECFDKLANIFQCIKSFQKN